MIDVHKDGDLWYVTLNRPEKANSLTPDMLATLIEVVGDAHGVAKCLILSGVGNVFSAGADLDAAKAGLATSPLWEELSTSMAALPCLTIAALNGTLAGGAFGMALACDLRIAVPEAKFFYPVMTLGYFPQPSDPKRLVALIGPARAKMILMAGQKIGADEAVSWGLIDRVVARDDLMSAALDLGRTVLAAPVSHVAGIKGLVRCE